MHESGSQHSLKRNGKLPFRFLCLNSFNVAVAKFSHTFSCCLQVKLDQGLQVLKIFKDHVCKTSILDDFSFYDDREKIMQEKKSKRQHPVEV
jgi:hypothetical protein